MIKFRTTLWVILLFISVINPFLTLGQQKKTKVTRDSPTFNVDSVFTQGVLLFKKNSFQEAVFSFNRIFDKVDSLHRYEVTYLFLAKCYNALNQKKLAEQILLRFIKSYPGSVYCNDARYLLIDLFSEQKNYKQSLIQAIQLEKETTIPGSIDLFYYLGRLINTDLEKTLESFKSDSLEDDLYFFMGKSFYQNNALKEAEDFFLHIITGFPGSKYYNQALKYYRSDQNIKTNEQVQPIIGVILPLSMKKNPDERTSADEVLDGIKFAINEHNNNSTLKTGLLIRNTQRDSTRLKQIADEFTIVKNSIVAIIGPLYSDESYAAASIFKNASYPIISPTATEASLTEKSDNFFQANPGFRLRGKGMAEYIFKYDNKRSVGLIYSLSGYSKECAEGFKETFLSLGGSISYESIYDENFPSVAKSVNGLLSHLTETEGLFVPVSNKQTVNDILTCLTKDSIYIPLYGNQDWFNAKGMETYTNISNGLIFSSDYFLDYTDEDFLNVNKAFFEQFHYEMNRNVLYGYDDALFTLQAYVTRNDKADKNNNTMNLSTGIKGFHNDFYFDTNRINHYINIIRYYNGVYDLLKRYKIE